MFVYQRVHQIYQYKAMSRAALICTPRQHGAKILRWLIAFQQTREFDQLEWGFCEERLGYVAKKKDG